MAEGISLENLNISEISIREREKNCFRATFFADVEPFVKDSVL